MWRTDYPKAVPLRKQPKEFVRGCIRVVTDVLHPEEVRPVILAALEELGSPRAQMIYSLLASHQDLDVARIPGLNPNLYPIWDLEKLRKDWVATELVRKYPLLEGTTPRSRKEVAISSALEAEARNLETNRKIGAYLDGFGYNPTFDLLPAIRRKIAYVLKPFNLEKLIQFVRWGPGADALNKRPFVSSYHKFKSSLAGPRSCAPYATAILEQNHIWATWLCGHAPEGPVSPFMHMVNWDKVTTVPKTALSDRTIGVGPPFAVYLQLGIGQMIRIDLRRIGIDLNTQEWNKWLALDSSKDDSDATIDLTNASELNSRGLIQAIFLGEPEKYPHLTTWFQVLDNCRMKFAKFPGDRVPRLLHKWSAMGNGYTFELETLVFWAIASTVCDREGGKVSAVYGDDIIVSKHAAHKVMEALEGFGFQVNTRKTFTSGAFRESCGMNAWYGNELHAYRIETDEWDAPSLYSLHNGLRRLGLHKSANKALQLIHRDVRFFGPEAAGDNVLVNPDIATWKGQPYGMVDQWFFWSYKLACIRYKPHTEDVSAYEPALLHSFATMVPGKEHSSTAGLLNLMGIVGRQGSRGLATLAAGEWTVGEVLIDRFAAMGRTVSS